MADLSHIPDEAVKAAARALNLQASDGLDEWGDLLPKEQRRFVADARRALAAALPYLNTARATCDEPMPVEGNAEEAQTCDHPAIPGTNRCPVHDPRHQRYIDGLNDEIRHLRQLHDERDRIERSRTKDITTREAIAAELESIADDDTGWAIGGYLRKRAASLRGKQ